MNGGKYVFSQVGAFLPQRAFDTIVSRYKGDYRVRHFSCWNQLLCMMYGQLSNRDSMSDLVLTINAHSAKAYHLGFGKGVSKANLAKSNVNRDCRIFQEFAYHIILLPRQGKYVWQKIVLRFRFPMLFTLSTRPLLTFASVCFAGQPFGGQKEQ
jgi:hypothetical protein